MFAGTRRRGAGFSPKSMIKSGKGAIKATRELASVLEARQKQMRSMEMERGKEYFEAQEFEMKNARRISELEENKLTQKASEELSRVFSSELNPAMTKMLSQELAKYLGHDLILQLGPEKLKELLIKSPTLKEIIFKLKNSTKISRREMRTAVEEIKELAQESEQ